MKRRIYAALALVLCAGASGCIRRTHVVPQVKPAQNVKTATLEQLVAEIDKRDDAIHTLSLTVDIAASVGGAKKGSVTDYTSFSGYILLEKPNKLRVLGLLPVVHTRAFDMASNGSTFQMWIPTKNKVIQGSDKIINPAASPLENMRPYIFVESLLVKAVKPEDFTYLAGETTYQVDPNSKLMLEKLDYDVGVLHRKGDTNHLLPSRIIHINREDLMPYEQDVYDPQGVIETEAFYSDYKSFGGVVFPGTIKIKRPQEEYEITLTINKLTANQPLADDQFELKLPEGVVVQQLP
jgi:outer membrane lipoprotein-sorting protein